MKHFAITELLREKGYFEKLNSLYSSLPSGECDACTRCCSESVNVSFLELVNIIENGISKRKLEELRPGILRYFLLEFVKPMKCPFLSTEGQCEIYEFRPLPCRLFGNTTERAYDLNYQAIHKQNRILAKEMMEKDQIMLPKTVIHKSVGYCKTYNSKKKLNTEDVDSLYGQLLHLDASLSMVENLDVTAYGNHLVGGMIEVIMAESECKTINKNWLLKEKMAVLYAVNQRSFE